MKQSLYTFTYAAVLGTVCALLLTGAGRFTASYREANAQAEKVRNILAVLEVPFEPRAASQELLAVFERYVLAEERGDLTLYLYVDPEAGQGLKAVAVPFAGQGLWGPIKGFLALKPDLKTIHGVTFYEQEETPGSVASSKASPSKTRRESAASASGAEAVPQAPTKSTLSPVLL